MVDCRLLLRTSVESEKGIEVLILTAEELEIAVEIVCWEIDQM